MELPVTPHDKVLAYLPLWQELRHRHYRSPGDAELKKSWETVSDRMDTLIDALMRNIVVVTPVERYESSLVNPKDGNERGKLRS